MQPHPQQAGQAGAPAAPAVTAHPQPPALAPGTILMDRYLIQGYINGGGFGHIYKALDNALGYRRAIKEAFYHDPQTRQQFHLEAEFLINVRHPNLVAGYAVFEQDGRLYLVMDYVDGHTLEEIAIDHIRRSGRPLSEAHILDWVLPVCGALQALHSSPKPVIHRDVKPANVKVTRQGTPVLIDLGLAKLFAPGTTTLGAALAFTPGYAPPEQYQANGTTDGRTDIYGMGASLFYLLTGYQPTEAPARLGSLAVPPLRQLNPAISPLTEAAVIKAMELLPDLRQQSALELERDLRAARNALTNQVRQDLWSLSVQPGLACDTCGTSNPADARHCMRCGAPMARTVEPSAGESALVAPEESAAPGQAAGAPKPKAAAGPVTEERSPVGTTDVVVFASPLTPAPTSVDPTSVEVPEPHPSLVPSPDSVPDQPAMVLPPLRHGPAPAAKPLADSRPAVAATSSARPAGAWRIRGGQPRTPAVDAPRAAAAGVALPTAIWGYALPSLRHWHAETLNAAAPLDDTEARLSLAGVMSLVLAMCTLLSVRIPLALLLALPALALGHWCQRAACEHAIPEARWLATLGVAISYVWLALYVAGWLAISLRTWL
jgi:serine/threonine protein kinase